ncbi:AraC family transcriptional regulator [Wenjunlia tyrosinilytica]|uniref:Transcriptional regulator n=1 Tax=Wenjunlia tyrosinilytica TaxID=1544741 RepID=A0A917ZSN8_9ACTN|nr:AraC family transcriptional regulator [Wenjunlia tyrosinilytica]GGO91552.1 transcriptional regulator [Wenjunlia tyrosinilytica]
MGAGESAHYWQHPGVPGVDLLRARFVRHAFTRHTHDTYVIAAVTRGVEEFHYRGTVERAGPGTVAMVNPDGPHTGHAGVPEGWSYHVLYPAVDVVGRIAEEVSSARGTPSFRDAVVADPRNAALVTAVHRAAERDDALAADSLLRIVVARLLRTHAEPLPARPTPGAGARAAARAREILEERMADPPSLEQLAAEVGTAPFSLLRAFRDAYGLPPHAWLTGARVRRTRALLDAGITPAQAAAEVGFHDQPHLNRHFTRIVGVPPGIYRQGRKNVQDLSEEPRLR